MRIGVIGAGNVGGTLATALGRAGNDVTVGVRSPEGREVENAAVASVADALTGADAVILALPGPAVEAFLRDHGPELDGIVVIDAANSVGGPGPSHHADAFAQHAPGALMVRAFNTLGGRTSPIPPSATNARITTGAARMRPGRRRSASSPTSACARCASAGRRRSTWSTASCASGSR
jgi:hypothetical protein